MLLDYYFCSVLLLLLCRGLDTKPSEYNDMVYNDHVDLFDYWRKDVQCLCNNKINIYSGMLFEFSSLLIDGRKLDWNASLDIFDNNVNDGLFQVNCNKHIDAKLLRDTMHIPFWLDAVKWNTTSDVSDNEVGLLSDHIPNIVSENRNTIVPPNKDIYDNVSTHITLSTTFTIAVRRYEHANIYWMLMDIYDVFLTLRFFNKTPEETDILFIDSLKNSPLDILWETLFNSVKRISSTLYMFENMVWCFPRTKSPLLQKQEELPLLSQFRHFILTSFDINPNFQSKCRSTEDYNIVLVLRKDYEAFSGAGIRKLSRKIKNEEQLVNATLRIFPYAHLRAVQMDLLSMHEQLSLLATTDILIGMHGAGLSYSLVLPEHALMVELFPLTQADNWHMEYLSKWRRAIYKSWHNQDTEREDFVEKTTRVPTDVLEELLRDGLRRKCS